MEAIGTFEYLCVKGPWLCFVGFNAILNTSENQSTRQPQITKINAFREALETC